MKLYDAADTAQAAIDGVANAILDHHEDGTSPQNAADTLADIAVMLRRAMLSHDQGNNDSTEGCNRCGIETGDEIGWATGLCPPCEDEGN